MSNPVFKPRRSSFKSSKPVIKRHSGHTGRERESEDKLSGWVEKAGFSLLPEVPQKQTPPQIHIRMANYTFSDRGVMDPSKCQYTWYQIPSVDLANREFMNGPLDRSLGDMPRDVVSFNSTAVALLPRIYVIGGGGGSDQLNRLPNSTAVYSYDITSPEKGWERRPDMRHGRQIPSAVAIDGKIYVFGGMVEGRYRTSKENTKPYAEVYDPVLDTWEELSDGNGNNMVDTRVCHGHALFLDQRQRKHVLVPTYYSRSLFTYDISSNSFTFREFLSHDYAGYVAAVVDGILYYYNHGCIHGYDLRECRWLPVQGLCKGTVLPGDDSLSLTLLNIGDGKLCIIYGRSLPRENGKLCIMCSVVRLRKKNYSDGSRLYLDATVQSLNTYIVPGHDLEDCIVA